MEFVKIEMSVDTAERLAESIKRDLNHFPPDNDMKNLLCQDYKETKKSLQYVRSELINEVLRIKATHTGEVKE